MRACFFALGCLPLFACGEEVAPPPEQIQCGDAISWDLGIEGRVEDASGAAVAGAEVLLEDRGWNNGSVLGTATTDGSGGFFMDATGVTSMDNCWGTHLLYTLVATEGARVGEKSINSYLHSAINDGGVTAVITDFPVVIE